MTINRLLFGAAGLAALLSASQASADVSKEIHDWSVNCSSGLTCYMSFSNVNWDGRGINELFFVRTDDPNAEVELQVSPPPGFDKKGDVKGVYDFVIDGKVALTLPVEKLKREGANLAYSDDAIVRALLSAMKAGRVMQLNYRGDLGTFSLMVKLAGVAGSMLYMDDAQDRLKRTDALEDKGDLAPPKTVQAEDIVNIKDLPATIRRDFAEGGDCNGIGDNIAAYQGFRMSVEDADLYVVPCGEGGPYNQPYAAYFAKDGKFRRANFPGHDDYGKMSIDDTAYNLDVDPKKRVFTAFFKGRGIGDCGVLSKWRLTGGKKPTLELAEERRKDNCDDSDESPDQFPLTWSAPK